MSDHEHEYEDDEDSVELSNDLAAAQDEGVPSSVERTSHADPADDDDFDGDGDGADDEGGDEDDADEGDDDDESDADDEGVAEARAGKKKGKQSAKERIEELARLRREAERQAFEAELREIEKDRRIAELERLTGQGQGQGEDDDPEPNPANYSYGHVDDNYVNDLVDWKARQQVRQYQQQESVRLQQQQDMQKRQHYMTRMNEVLEAGEKKFPGFKDAVNATTYDADLARQVLDSDRAVDLAYHLANNLTDLRALLTAAPSDRARLLGRLEGRLSAPSAAKKRTRAPEVPGSGRVKKKSSTRYGPDDQDEFDKAYFG